MEMAHKVVSGVEEISRGASSTTERVTCLNRAIEILIECGADGWVKRHEEELRKAIGALSSTTTANATTKHWGMLPLLMSILAGRMTFWPGGTRKRETLQARRGYSRTLRGLDTTSLEA